MDASGQFYIWSNIHQKWWADKGVGFTARLELAGCFTASEAIEIYRKAAEGWLPYRPFDISVTLVPV